MATENRPEWVKIEKFECSNPDCGYEGKAKWDKYWGDICPDCDLQFMDSDIIQE